MSRNFRQAQLLDAFDFDGNEHLRQLAEGFTNIRSGVGTPTVTANDGELFYDTRGMFLYVREGGAWIRAGSAADIPTISSLLDTLSYQTEYTYGSLLPADYISASGDAFHDGAFLTLVFRLGYTVPETLYGFTTPPGTAATTAEPDVVIQQRNPGINFGGFQQVPFIILKGVELIPQFELGRNIPTILNTLYTRTATTGFEYLTKTATGTYEFTVPPEFEDTNTEYTFADGTGGTFTVTPSDTGVAQTVNVGAGGVESGATFPTSPTAGQIFVLTTSITGPPAFDEGVYIYTAQGQWQPADIVSINTIGPPGTATSQNLGKIVYAQQSDSFWISDGTEWHLMTVALGSADFTTGDEVAFDTRVANVRTRFVATVSNTYEDVRIETPAMGDHIPTEGFSLAPETNSSNQVAFITIGLPNNTLSTAFMNSLAVGDRIVTATEGRDNRTFGIIASASDLNTANRTVRLTLECAATPNGFILAPFPAIVQFPDAPKVRSAGLMSSALPRIAVTLVTSGN